MKHHWLSDCWSDGHPLRAPGKCTFHHYAKTQTHTHSHKFFAGMDADPREGVRGWGLQKGRYHHFWNNSRNSSPTLSEGVVYVQPCEPSQSRHNVMFTSHLGWKQSVPAPNRKNYSGSMPESCFLIFCSSNKGAGWRTVKRRDLWLCGPPQRGTTGHVVGQSVSVVTA